MTWWANWQTVTQLTQERLNYLTWKSISSLHMSKGVLFFSNPVKKKKKSSRNYWKELSFVPHGRNSLLLSVFFIFARASLNVLVNCSTPQMCRMLILLPQYTLHGVDKVIRTLNNTIPKLWLLLQHLRWHWNCSSSKDWVLSVNKRRWLSWQ